MTAKLWSRLEAAQAHKITPRVINSGQGARLEIGGRSLLNFCSSHYLGFAEEDAGGVACIVFASVGSLLFLVKAILVVNMLYQDCIAPEPNEDEKEEIDRNRMARDAGLACCTALLEDLPQLVIINALEHFNVQEFGVRFGMPPCTTESLTT